ncbi:hypothetical protein ADEAN_000292100 [Angomonas deanei]|uniref:Divergent AAA domain containing protein n=1 Tax=Angomonas deanei TaxID=59799 RepID=A0A7G2C6V8_9TRYP|nr:hypothetical protein ADEAN_000292100 [Angomonas deanei]
MPNIVDLCKYNGAYSKQIAADIETSKALAAAVNTMQHEGVLSVELQFHLSSKATPYQGELRELKDEFFRCVDRALVRVYPPLDPMHVLTHPIVFEESPDQHDVSARVIVTKADGQSMPCKVDGVEVKPFKNASAAPSGSDAASAFDDDLWQRARAANAKVDDEIDENNQEKLVKFKSRLSRFCAERIINEANWALGKEVRASKTRQKQSTLSVPPRYKDIADAAQKSKGSNALLHADGRGLQFNASVVGYVGHYAVLGVRKSDRTFYVVARIPKPEFVGEVHINGNKRSRAASEIQLENVKNVLPYRKERDITILDEFPVVSVRAHRVRYGRTKTPERDPEIVMEEVFMMEEVGTAPEEGDDSPTHVVENTLTDIIVLVQQSCNRFLADRLRYSEYLGESDSVKGDLVRTADNLFVKLNDCASPRFRKVRGKDRVGNNTAPVVHACRDIQGLTEGPMVEFKQRVSAGQDEEEQAETNRQQYSVMRLRGTIAGMASLHGGVVLIGVGDSGAVVGHPSGEVTSQLYTSAFFPAMVTGAVTLVEIRATSEGETVKKAMPKDWWKNPGRGENFRGGWRSWEG